MKDKLLKIISPINYNLSLTSNVLEQNIGRHPIILFMDELKNYWYLKCRSASYLRNSNKLKRSFKGEVLIHENQENNKLFWNNIYVDTSHLFHINCDDFEYLVDKYKNNFLLSNELLDDNVDRIFENVIHNIAESQPNINMIKVNVDKNNDSISFYTEYASQTRFNLEFDNYMKNYGNMPKYASKIDHIKQLKNEIESRNSIIEKRLKKIGYNISNYHLEIIKGRLFNKNEF